MYKLIFSDRALISADKFIIYLNDYYDRFYSDTWLWDIEDLIKHRYIEETNKLYDEFIFSINDSINKWIFWNILETNWWYELSKLVIFVRSYILVVYCKKNVDKKIIYIEELEIRT